MSYFLFSLYFSVDYTILVSLLLPVIQVFDNCVGEFIKL